MTLDHICFTFDTSLWEIKIITDYMEVLKIASSFMDKYVFVHIE